MISRPVLRHLCLGLLVLGGLALGHDLAFGLAAGTASDHAHLLAVTGHGAWTPTRTTATVLVMLLVVLGAPPRRRVAPPCLVGSYARVVVRLTLLQTGAFIALEMGERLAHGTAIADLAHDPVLLAGTLVQLGVGLLGGLLLVAAVRGLTSLPRPLRPCRPDGSWPAPAHTAHPLRARPLAGDVDARAPPCMA